MRRALGLLAFGWLLVAVAGSARGADEKKPETIKNFMGSPIGVASSG